MPGRFVQHRHRDANEPRIIAGLEKLGFQVFRIDQPGDLAVWCPCGRWWVIEVKNPQTHTRAKGKDPRTASQRELDPRVTASIPIVYTVDDLFGTPLGTCCSMRQVPPDREPRAHLEGDPSES